MMVAQHEEVLRPTALVAFHQRLGIPPFGLEQWQYVLESYLRRMAVVFHVVFILSAALLIHAAGHPVA